MVVVMAVALGVRSVTMLDAHCGTLEVVELVSVKSGAWLPSAFVGETNESMAGWMWGMLERMLKRIVKIRGGRRAWAGELGRGNGTDVVVLVVVREGPVGIITLA